MKNGAELAVELVTIEKERLITKNIQNTIDRRL